MSSYGKKVFYEVPPHPAVKAVFAACFLLFLSAFVFVTAAPDDRQEEKVLYFCAVCMFIAAASIAGGIYGYRSNSAIGSWTRVRGVITRSGVLSYDDSSSDSGGTRTVTLHRPDICFEYTYGGTTYRGDRVMVGEASSSDPSASAGTAATYPVGKEVHIFVNPQSPDQSLLEFDPKAPRAILFISFGLAAGFALFGVMMFCSVEKVW